MTVHASRLPFRLGVFGHNHARVAGHEATLGRPVDVLQVSPTRGSWSAVLNGWWLNTPAGFEGWLDVAVPLWQADGNSATAAQGGYNAQWKALGKLIHDRYPGSTIRPGWEFNLPSWPWKITPGNRAEWILAWRHAYTSLKEAGPSLLVEWCPNAGSDQTGVDARDAWPGDNYVDVVAIDSYDWWPPYTTDGNWAQHRDGEGGWNYWYDFAVAHGKLFAVPEFGGANGGQATSGGDNPKFMSYLMPWIAERVDNMLGINYFDETASYIRNSIAQGSMQLPLLAAEYRAQLDAIEAAHTLPPVPLVVTAAETGPGEATVTWEPPIEATVSRDGTDTDGDGPWTDTATGSYIFSRLRDGDTYTFTVTAGTRTGSTQLTIGAPEPEPEPETATVTLAVPAAWLTPDAPTHWAIR